MVILLLLVLATSASAHTTLVRPRTVADLQRSIDRAQPFDTLVIAPGVITGSDLTIGKPLTIIGRKGAVVDAAMKGTSAIFVDADNVTIDGLAIRNVAVSFSTDNAAIKVRKRRHALIRNCRIDNAVFGVYLSDCKQSQVVGNRFTAYYSEQSKAGNGVHCWTGRDILIKDNVIDGHRDGVYLEFMHRVTVTNNICIRNLRYGLHFMFSDSCSYRRNRFEHNGAGVAVMYSSWVEMTENIFEDNWGVSTYGLLLKDIRDSHIRGNTFHRNSIGVYAEAASRILFDRNSFTGNGYALRMLANCDDNTVRNNDFVANSFDVTTNSKDSRNHFDRNYWSPYEGYDLDRDGYGDVPYHPVRLYSLLVEQLPSSVILMHSAFVNLLDVTERVVPTMTPETLIDHHPRMKPLSP